MLDAAAAAHEIDAGRLVSVMSTIAPTAKPSLSVLGGGHPQVTGR